MFEVITRGFLMGLTTGLTCLGYCAPIFIPYLFSEKNDFKINFFRIIKFLGGRLTAYILWGIIIGITATLIKTPMMDKISAYAVFGSAILLIIYGVIKNFPQLRVCQRFEQYKIIKQFPFLLGLTVGLNLCPPFIMSFSYLINIGKVTESVIFFIFFFLGTTIYMIPFFFSHWITKWDWLRVFARVSTIVAGVSFLIYGISLIRRI